MIINVLQKSKKIRRQNWNVSSRKRIFPCWRRCRLRSKKVQPYSYGAHKIRFGKGSHDSQESADRFHIDANTKVTVEELGKQRETDTLSTGYRELIGICLRMALVDAMYREETPVLIMDDPFANLDDKKILAGRDFIKKIAETYQIIYFTCSNSRR